MEQQPRGSGHIEINEPRADKPFWSVLNTHVSSPLSLDIGRETRQSSKNEVSITNSPLPISGGQNKSLGVLSASQSNMASPYGHHFNDGREQSRSTLPQQNLPPTYKYDPQMAVSYPDVKRNSRFGPPHPPQQGFPRPGMFPQVLNPPPNNNLVSVPRSFYLGNRPGVAVTIPNPAAVVHKFATPAPPVLLKSCIPSSINANKLMPPVQSVRLTQIGDLKRAGDKQPNLKDSKRPKQDDQGNKSSDDKKSISMTFTDPERIILMDKISNGSRAHQLELFKKIGITKSFDNKWLDPWKCYICESKPGNWKNYVGHCCGNRHKFQLLEISTAFGATMRRKLTETINAQLTVPPGGNPSKNASENPPLLEGSSKDMLSISDLALTKPIQLQGEDVHQCKPCGRFFDQYDKLSVHEASNPHWKRVNYLKNRFGAHWTEYKWYAQTNTEKRDKQEPMGVAFIVPISGYFCKLCSKFYNSEVQAKDVHCRQLLHVVRVKEFDRDLKRGPSGKPVEADTVAKIVDSRFGEQEWQKCQTRNAKSKDGEISQEELEEGEIGENEIREMERAHEKDRIVKEWEKREKLRKQRFGSDNLLGQSQPLFDKDDEKPKEHEREKREKVVDKKESDRKVSEHRKVERDRGRSEKKEPEERDRGRSRRQDRKEKEQKEMKEKEQRKDKDKRRDYEKKERKIKDGFERKEKDRRDKEEKDDQEHLDKLKRLQEQHELELKKIHTVELAKLELRVKEQELREKDLAFEKERLRQLIGSGSTDSNVLQTPMTGSSGELAWQKQRDQMEKDMKELRERRFLYQSMCEIGGRENELKEIEEREKERQSMDAKERDMFELKQTTERKEGNNLQMQDRQKTMADMKAQELSQVEMRQRNSFGQNTEFERNRPNMNGPNMNDNMHATDMRTHQHEMQRKLLLNDLRLKAITELEMKARQLRENGFPDLHIQQLMIREQALMDQRIVDELRLRGFGNDGPASRIRKSRSKSIEPQLPNEREIRSRHDTDGLDASNSKHSTARERELDEKNIRDMSHHPLTEGDKLALRMQREREYGGDDGGERGSYSNTTGLDSERREYDDRRDGINEERERYHSDGERLDYERQRPDLEIRGSGSDGSIHDGGRSDVEERNSDLQSEGSEYETGVDDRRRRDFEREGSNGEIGEPGMRDVRDSEDYTTRRGRYHNDYGEDGERSRSNDIDDGTLSTIDRPEIRHPDHVGEEIRLPIGMPEIRRTDRLGGIAQRGGRQRQQSNRNRKRASRFSGIQKRGTQRRKR